MVNPFAGEVALTLDGQRHIAKLTLGALAELETALETGSLVELVERFVAAGLVPVGSTAEAMTNSVRQDVPRFNALVKSIGIKPE